MDRSLLGMALGFAVVLLLLLVPMASAAPPANDDFADAEDLGSSLPVDITRSNDEATKETGEPFDPFAAGHSVWFKWEAPSDGFVTIGSCVANFPIRVHVVTGSALGSLTEVASGNADEGPHCRNEGREFTFKVTSGITYMILVDGNGFSFGPPLDTEGDFTLRIEATPPPTNDDFENAIPLTDEGASEALGYRATASGYTWGAGKEAGEPSHAGNSGGASVWYTWTAPASGAANVFACCGWAPLVGVYTGNTVNALTAAVPAPGLPLGARVFVTAGTTYRIAIDGEFDTGAGVARTAGFRVTASMPLPARDDTADPPSPAPADLTSPNTRISKRVLKRVPPVWIFSFGSNEPGSTFQCKLDKRPFRKCRSSKTFRNLKPGKHTLKVRAIDPSGNVDKSPAVARFTVPGKTSAKR